jgi:DNA-binding GntR family transcriptional regulator
MFTRTEQCADRLRVNILQGRFAPGEVLSQRQLARELGCSPIVVRESLRMLENQGLVENVPKWGTRIVPFDVERLRGLFMVREALEGMAARLVCSRRAVVDFGPLLTHAQALDRLFAKPPADAGQLATEHYGFHSTIDSLCGCAELIETLSRVNLQQLFLASTQLVDFTRVRQPPRWHLQLVQALAGPDPDAAEQVMRAHVRKGLEDIAVAAPPQGPSVNGRPGPMPAPSGRRATA